MGSSQTGQMMLDCLNCFLDCLPLEGLPAIVDAKNRNGAVRGRVRPPRLYPVANLEFKGSWADHTLLSGSTV